ncbi:MAG: CotH kinase family protein [bacterium]|nr:CotH kinase family protein [bacterium]MBU1917100.1 CotH kinase family protein [bacterium]
MSSSRIILILLVFFVVSCGGSGGKYIVPGDKDTTDESIAVIENKTVYDQDELDVITLHVTVETGGATLDEVNTDDDDSDDFQPEAVVSISESGYTFADGASTASGMLRVRGASSRNSDQKSYRIKLDSKEKLWRNHRILQLNKHPYDLTRMRQKLAFDYFKDIPYMTSLRTQFVHLYIDGVDFGLFTLIERCNKSFLENHGLDKDGRLYKAQDFSFYRDENVLLMADDPDYNVELFEEVLDIRRAKDDNAQLLYMLDAVNDETTGINDVIEEQFHRNNYLTWFAINILLKNEDTTTQNFFLYCPLTSSKWYFLPWDYDGAWDFYGQPVEAAAKTRPRWTQGVSNWWGNALHKRFLQDADNVQDLVERVEELKETVFTATSISERTEIYKNLIFDIITVDPDIEELPALDNDTVAEIEAELNTEIDRLASIPQESYNMFISAMERPMPIWMGYTELSDGTLQFVWDESYDLQGNSITYNFQISTRPTFIDASIVYESLGLTETTIDVTGLASGTYYFRVIIRDSEGNWQLPFDSYDDGETVFDGMLQFSL